MISCFLPAQQKKNKVCFSCFYFHQKMSGRYGSLLLKVNLLQIKLLLQVFMEVMHLKWQCIVSGGWGFSFCLLRETVGDYIEGHNIKRRKKKPHKPKTIKTTSFSPKPHEKFCISPQLLLMCCQCYE